MFNLVLKDILIQKKSLILYCLVSFIFTLINQTNSNNSTMLFIMIPVFISYSLLMGACTYDDKNKCHIMLNSFPVNRIDLVISKYLSTFVFMFIGFLLIFLITTILNFSGFSHFSRMINLEDILGFSISIILLSSIYFPIYFKFGYYKLRYVNMVLFMSGFFIPPMLVGAISKGTAPNFILYLNSQPNWLVNTFAIIATFIILLSSMLLSARFYLNKDL